MSDSPNPFQWHEPPPGGVQTLRARLRDERPRSSTAPFALAAAALLAVSAVVTLQATRSPAELPAELQNSAALMRLGVVDSPRGVELVGEGVLQPVSFTSEVAYYRHIAAPRPAASVRHEEVPDPRARRE